MYVDIYSQYHDGRGIPRAETDGLGKMERLEGDATIVASTPIVYSTYCQARLDIGKIQI